jgi:glycosyltransferase involved in cell wall biosynthesis
VVAIPKISLCIITRNEAHNLERCIRSVPFADEVVVLDSESSDATAAVARRLGARVHVEAFRGHVLQKARAVELAENRWVLCLDADEELSTELAAEIQEALREVGSVLGFELPRKTFYLGRFIEHGGWWPEHRLRLFDRAAGGWTGADPHDRVEVQGRVRRLRAPLYHYNYRDLRHHLEKVNAYTSIMAQGMADRGASFSWRAALLRPPARFLRMFVLRRGFLDGWRGFVIATIAAFYVFLKYVKLWELIRGECSAAPPVAREPAATGAREPPGQNTSSSGSDGDRGGAGD